MANVLPVICVVGCTASGKSALADTLAQHLGGEVVSADSMQIYRGMDIGTAKVPAAERSVAYHCIDIVDPGESYSAALFQRDARAAFCDIHSRGKAVVLCGGTNLYIRAALDQMEFATGDQEHNPVREKYTALAEELGANGLHALLAQRDPESAALIHPNNVRRVVRAFEMLEQGESYAVRKRAFKGVPTAVENIKIGLAVDVELLYERINARVDQMLENGLLEEVRGLLDAGFRDGLTAPQAIGYKEIVAYFDGACTLSEALDAIKQATRRYSKQQRTWLRADKSIHWVDANGGLTEELLENALEFIQD